jgi:filamentous hemagglutinin family protein
MQFPVSAQITPDATLSNPSGVTSNGNVRGITGGVTQGSNLFHSFEQFSVSSGTTSWFNNPLDIQNIFARVTGSSVSRIDGRIQANGNANLFLLNPNGIIFGSNAQLNIGGSFISSTANSIRFADGSEFSAANPRASSLLTITTPIGLQYGSNPEQITVQGTGNGLGIDPDTLTIIRNERPQGLQVQPGQTLALVGGDIFLQGGNLTAAAGRIELGAVGSASTVSLTPSSDGWQLGYGDVPRFQDIYLSQAASADTSGSGSGTIQLQGRQIVLTDGSSLLANTQGERVGSGVEIAASESVQVLGVRVDSGSGEVVFPSSIYVDVEPGATGTGGNLTISTGRLSVIDGGQVSTTTFGLGNSGNMSVTAQTVELMGGAAVVGASGLFALVELNASGSAGNITLASERLWISGGALISASSFGAGNSGHVKVTAESMELSGTSPGGFPSGIFAQAEEGSTGNGGTLSIRSGTLRLIDGAQISSSTIGIGNAGDVRIRAEAIELIGSAETIDLPSAIFSTVQAGAMGQGGNLTIQTQQLEILNGAQIAIATAGSGRAGDLVVTANKVELAGFSAFGSSGLFANAIAGTGTGGNVRINAEHLVVRDQATISASNFSSRNPGTAPGQGTAGNILISARQTQLDHQGTITASTAVGGRGNITLQSELLSLSQESRITTDSQGSEPGGNITLNTDFLVAQGNSDITANAINAQGGQVRITAQGIFGIEFRQQLTPESDITASSELGAEFSGVVEINTPDVDPSQGLVELPENVVDRSQQISAACEQFRGNELVITGRGGLPEAANQPLRGQSVWQDLRLTEEWSTVDRQQAEDSTQQSYPTSSPLLPTSDSVIREAQGWTIDENGQVRLVEYATEQRVHQARDRLTDCVGLQNK